MSSSTEAAATTTEKKKDEQASTTTSTTNGPTTTTTTPTPTTAGWKTGLKAAQGFLSGVGNAITTKAEEIKAANEAKALGKVWNPKTKEWYFYILDQEAEDLAETNLDSQHGAEGARGELKEVKDTAFYDLLGVPSNATSAEIKKAYYKEARKVHPDKNPDDPEAHAKFQKLGQAYQILSNDVSRADYDKNGISEDGDASLDASNVDPFVFFNVMFGSALVEPYIGELWIANTADTMMKDDGTAGAAAGLMEEPDPTMTQAEQRELMQAKLNSLKEADDVKQRKRQVKCAQNLRTRVEAYVHATDMDKASRELVVSAQEEALKIVKGAFGEVYCITIGNSFILEAEEFLGFTKTFLGVGGHLAKTRKSASALNNNMKLLGAGIKAASAGVKAANQAEDLQKRAAQEGKQELDESDAAKMEETMNESLPAFLELAWAINKRDIQQTLKQVCYKLFVDAAVEKELRIKRAEAVRILGRGFLSIGRMTEKAKSTDNFDPEDIKARLSVAAMTTMAKAQGQEVTEQDQEEMIKQAKQQMADAATAAETTTTTDEKDNEKEEEKPKA